MGGVQFRFYFRREKLAQFGASRKPQDAAGWSVALRLDCFRFRFLRHSIMAEPVYVIGAGRTDFKRNFKKEGKTIRHVILEAARGAIGEAGVFLGDDPARGGRKFGSGLVPPPRHPGAVPPRI